MINFFTESLLNLLEKLKGTGHLPIMNSLLISENNVMKLQLNMVDEFQLKDDSILKPYNASLCFMIMDSYIDSTIEGMEGKNFKVKYDYLPKKNNVEIIFSQIYRILRFYRNATVHNISGISYSKDYLEIESDKNNNILKITHNGLELIESFILCFFYYETINYSDLYKEYLYYSFYDDIIKEIVEYKDGDNNLISINSKQINRYERYNCQSINYKINDKKVMFEIPEKIFRNENYALDIHIKHEDSIFVVPIEAVDNNKSMNIEEFRKFKLK